MILPKQHLQSLHQSFQSLGSGLMDNLHQSQFQPCGIDITLKEVHRYLNAGKIDFDNTERKISNTEPMEFANDEITLQTGAYKVLFDEYVRIPADTAAICLPRSSLLRCGATLECALWDPGYEGRSEAMLIVRNPHGIILKRKAKIGQMIFIRLAEKASVTYEGQYLGENK